jgi:hypothetical protein
MATTMLVELYLQLIAKTLPSSCGTAQAAYYILLSLVNKALPYDIYVLKSLHLLIFKYNN